MKVCGLKKVKYDIAIIKRVYFLYLMWKEWHDLDHMLRLFVFEELVIDDKFHING